MRENSQKEVQGRPGGLTGGGFFFLECSKTQSENSRPECSTTHLQKEEAQLGFAPNVPPPITRKHAALVQVAMNVEVRDIPIDETHTYEAWTFNGNVPGPFIRAREGDTLEVTCHSLHTLYLCCRARCPLNR